MPRSTAFRAGGAGARWMTGLAEFAGGVSECGADTARGTRAFVRLPAEVGAVDAGALGAAGASSTTGATAIGAELALEAIEGAARSDDRAVRAETSGATLGARVESEASVAIAQAKKPPTASTSSAPSIRNL